MTRLILHIGPPKTATTHIQETLAHNRDALERAGVVYPLEWAGGVRSEHHHPFMQDLHAAFGNDAAPTKPELQATFDAWFADIAASHHRAYVLSSEGFPTVKATAWSAFVELASSHGVVVEMVIVLRSAHQWIVSEWGQQLKRGGIWSLPEFLVQSAAERNAFPRWSLMFRRITPAVPLERLHIVVLDGLDVDVVTWLCTDVLGVDSDLEPAPVARGNRRLSTAASESLRVAMIDHRQRVPDDPPDAMWRPFNTAFHNDDEALLEVVQRVEDRCATAPQVPVQWFAELCRPDHDRVLAEFGSRIRRDHAGAGLFPDKPLDSRAGAIRYANGLEDPELRAEISRIGRRLIEPNSKSSAGRRWPRRS